MENTFCWYILHACPCFLRALLSSQEAPEDDARLGILMLKKVRVLGHFSEIGAVLVIRGEKMYLTSDCICDQACEGKKHVVFIGVSCGLSVSHSAVVRLFFSGY